jgi:heavy metal sensor kinase
MTPLSIKWRIAICIILLLVCVISALSLVAYLELHETLVRDADSRLLSDAETILAILTSEDSSEEARREIRAFLNPNSGSEITLYRVWLDQPENIFSASASLGEQWATLVSLPRVQGEPEQALHWTVHMNQETYRGLWFFVQDPGTGLLAGHRINMVICHPIAHIADHLAIFWEAIALVGLLIVVLAVSLTLLILKWGLRPITNLTQRMDRISGKHLQRPAPLLLEGVPELRSFIQAWNRMLERLALAMQQQHRFTADASHELRTPLAIVKSTLQCARTRKRSISSYETSIDQSLEDLARLEHLIEQLLMLARLDDISTQYEHTTIDLENLVDEVCEQFRDFVKQHGDVLKWDSCHAEVMGSRDQLKRLISNFLDNAIKFGPAGGAITVVVTCSAETVNVRVHDEGGSIPSENHKHIFDRFYRIRNAGAQAAAGSGLGLALAKEIVTKHRGTISVDSYPGVGTDFTVILPLFHS